ncbi:hypothetical protein BCU70_09390 [Vibrio sp. 10N.286.49.C2]|uniref:hypothetical protein n=1 Tax=unclassified Vibrio TaxID=2614977 RepID=UPI000C826CC6|nr:MULTISPECIES: hypothetical protein [unclassified Vibrio]PMH26368.1 hypothetical protein BCU70_09390 [Vibrio sp. 10N.286.49.C2]PMH54908.1 hypothetical protein BCU66_11545 [Vibrio sp. 10N.286.49.B1]PMH81144.1 hypothetical protein BCU58_21915 [Vibrio sp. 10N.286.48.B7]
MSFKIRKQFALLSVFVALMAIYVYIAVPKISVSDAPIFSQARCSVDEAQGSASFRIYIPTDWNAQQLADDFCNRLLKNSQYSHVVVSWKPRQQLSADEMLGQQYELIMTRHREFNGLVPDYITLYREIVSYPKYSVYFYGQMTIAALSSSVFYKRTIGLLRDNKSQSGHLIPLITLKQLGVTFDQEHIRWFSNREQMLRAFEQQEVDFIPGLGIEPQLSKWPENKRVLLKTMPSLG